MQCTMLAPAYRELLGVPQHSLVKPRARPPFEHPAGVVLQGLVVTVWHPWRQRKLEQLALDVGPRSSSSLLWRSRSTRWRGGLAIAAPPSSFPQGLSCGGCLVVDPAEEFPPSAFALGGGVPAATPPTLH